jgi:hypothetical protein
VSGEGGGWPGPQAEQPLPGGGTLGAVRIADEVHRSARPWTSTVHSLLRYLERAGFDGAPRVIGFDEQGREVLTFLPGQTVGDAARWPDWAFSDGVLAQVGAWLRRLHQTTAAFVPPPGAAWFGERTWRPGYVIGHHDATPRNAVWDAGQLVGFIDWDTAGPAPAMSDLALAAFTWIPMSAVRVASQVGPTAFPERRRRLHLLLDAYGYHGDRLAFRRQVVERIREEATGIRWMARRGDPVYQAIMGEAADLDAALSEISSYPSSFWRRHAD